MTREITLTRGKVAFVDDGDYERVAAFKWHAQPSRGTWYAKRTIRLPDGRRTTKMMHRFILGGAAGVETDHWDGDGLNNTRRNLRPCTRSQNQANRRRRRPAGYRGVDVNTFRARPRFIARIGDGTERLYLGSFPSAEQAAKAYDAAAVRLYGEFALLNFPARP